MKHAFHLTLLSLLLAGCASLPSPEKVAGLNDDARKAAGGLIQTLGGELGPGQPVGEREENRDAFDRAGIDHGDVAVVEAAEPLQRSRLQERDRNVDCVHATPKARVLRYVMTDSDEAVELAELGGAGI
jgi:hypothetical protein